MERKKASDFPPEVLKLFDGYVHGGISRREFLDRAAKYAVGGVTAAAMLESLRPELRAGRSRCRRTTRAFTPSTSTYPSPQGIRATMRGYFARPATATRQAAGRRRHPREPRPQSVHRGRRAPARRRELRRVRARRADAGRRLSGRRGKGARKCSRGSTQRSVPRTCSPQCRSLKSRPECNGKRRRRRLLLRRRHRQPDGRRAFPTSPRPCRSTAASRAPTTVREDQGAAADSLRRGRRAASTPDGRHARPR